ncbi:MAG: hypothetical protein IIA60_06255 [Candidatus Marinimicrobia bacterium]|nr:hypothetical protein [Candidatus Neomarinimicrobiota bacterium]
MDKFIVSGGHTLSGEITVSGAKNAVLPIMAACLLHPDKYTLHNVPDLRDTRTMVRLLEIIGARVSFDRHVMVIDSSDCHNPEAPYDLVKTMRASFYVLGPLLARFGSCKVSLPGGCNWGPRPVDLHLKAMEALGANIDLKEGYILAQGRLKGAVIDFPVSSVGATGNAMMAAVLVPTMSLPVKHFELGVFATDPIELPPEAMDLWPTMPPAVSAFSTEPQPHIQATEAAPVGALAEGGSGDTRFPWRGTLMFGWMTVTLILLGRLLIAFINGVRLIRRSQPKVCAPIQQALDWARARLEISRGLQVRSSREISSPMIWCWSKRRYYWCPVIRIMTSIGPESSVMNWHIVCGETISVAS